MSASAISRKVFAALLFMLLSSALWGNPLIKPRDEKAPEPVRPPAFGASEGLINAQLRFREAMADLFSDLKEERSPGALAGLLGAGFLYGILHALGPGHRKTVMFSLFVARKARLREPLAAGFLSALLHGLSALFLITIFRSLSNRLLVEKVNLGALYMEGFTYLLLALMGGVLLVLEVRRHQKSGENPGSNRGLYGTIVLTGFFPCPAAIMILIFSMTLDLFALGALTVAALSLGMGVTVSLIGILAWGGRETLFHRMARGGERIGRLSHLLEGASYSFLILFSLWMAYPFLVSLPGLF